MRWGGRERRRGEEGREGTEGEAKRTNDGAQLVGRDACGPWALWCRRHGLEGGTRGMRRARVTRAEREGRAARLAKSVPRAAVL